MKSTVDQCFLCHEHWWRCKVESRQGFKTEKSDGSSEVSISWFSISDQRKSRSQNRTATKNKNISRVQEANWRQVPTRRVSGFQRPADADRSVAVWPIPDNYSILGMRKKFCKKWMHDLFRHQISLSVLFLLQRALLPQPLEYFLAGLSLPRH